MTDATVNRDEVASALVELGVDAAMARWVPALDLDVEALLLYGSRARGDAVPGSDLDLLALVPSSRRSMTGHDVSVSFYTAHHLESGIGTLFGEHLKRDGKMVFDTTGRLTAAIAAMGEVDTPALFDRVRHLSTLFSTPGADLPRYLRGFTRQARYLLRSGLYARAIEEGRPCFSVRELAVRHQDPGLVELLASRHDHEPTPAELQACLTRLEALVGPFPSNPHGSLEATVVNEWGNEGDLLSMAFMTLGSSAPGFDYAEVRKMLL